jgi:predicted acylesterase/phospholipase RssA
LFGGAALADIGPLADLIARYIDRPFLDAIEAEYRKGRILLIGTTNLDAQRPVVWNMTQIAASRHPGALTLFRQVILASASIPGVFPPVHIKVEAGGELREEMHVDGGTTQKVFIAPLQLRLSVLDPLYSAPPQRRIYVISNAKLAPEWGPPRDDTRAIAERSLRTLSKSQGAGDLIRLYLFAKRDGAEFNLAAIPSSFRAKSREPFDRQYMRALFDVGFLQGRAGYRWLPAPPEIGAPDETQDR